MSTEKASIQFLNFTVKESHIVFKKVSDFKIDINFNPKGVILKSLSQFRLELLVSIKDTNGNFNIDIISESIFSYPVDADIEAYMKSLFITNAPAITFPYIRAYISSLTALSGMPTLILPTLNLSQVGAALKGNIEIIE